MAGNTPVYGFPYPEPTDLVADYPALGQQLAEDIETVLPTLGAMTLISPTSIANSGGTASSSNGTVTFNGANSVSLNGVFSASYDNYAIKARITNSGNNTTNLRLRSAGTDASGGNYNWAHHFVDVGSNTVTGAQSANATSFFMAFGGSAAVCAFEIFNPFEATTTEMVQTNFNSVAAVSQGGRHTLTTSYDGFSVIAAAGTITGVIRVYGYMGA